MTRARRSYAAPADREPRMAFPSRRDAEYFWERVRSLSSRQCRDELASLAIVLAFGGDLGGHWSADELAAVRAQVRLLMMRLVVLEGERAAAADEVAGGKHA